jgi:hypothetical protein
VPSRATTRPRSTWRPAQHQRVAVAAARRLARRVRGRAVAQVEWHRYPDRAATALREAIAEWHGVDPAQVFAANGSNEVLQTLLLTYAGPGRTVATFEPTYQMHAHIARVTGATVVEGERSADFTLDPAEVRRVIDRTSRTSTFLCSPNNPTGLVEPPERARRAARRRARARGRRRGVRPVRRLVRARPLVDDDVRWRSSRTFSKTWSMAASRSGTSSARRGSSPSSTRWCCRTTSTPPSRSPAGSRCGSSTTWTTAWPRSCRARAHQSTRWRRLDRRHPERRQLRAVPTRDDGGRDLWQALLDRRRARARLLELAAPRRLPARHRRHPAENDAFLAALAAAGGAP